MAKAATAVVHEFDPELVQSILAKIDNLKADLLRERGSSMSRCRGIHESIQNTYKEAKARGIPTRPLRALVKIREREEANRQQYSELEPDDQTAVSLLATAEGMQDLPLWRAAATAEAAAANGTRPAPMFQ
jgi:uncharacterized protein (UPF0335 family)